MLPSTNLDLILQENPLTAWAIQDGKLARRRRKRDLGYH